MQTDPAVHNTPCYYDYKPDGSNCRDNAVWQVMMLPGMPQNCQFPFPDNHFPNTVPANKVTGVSLCHKLLN